MSPSSRPFLLLSLLALTLTPTLAQERLLLCERETASITCPRGSYIDVLTATYGRTALLPNCRRTAESLSDTSCVLETSQILTEALCNGRRTCEFEVGQATYTNDPCVGTVKYLNATYTCVEPLPEGETRVVTACGATPLILACRAGSVVEVVSGFYGRSEDTTETCGRGPRSLDNTDCEADGAEVVIAEQCNGQRRCELTVTNALLAGSNPCLGTAKVAEVEYTCVMGTPPPEPTRAPSTPTATPEEVTEPATPTASPEPRSSPGGGTPEPTPEGTPEGTPEVTPEETPGETSTPSPTDGSGDDDEVCFPGDATVELSTGQTIPLRDLRVGDTIRTGSSPSSFHTVYFFSHAHPTAVSTFVEISTPGGHTLRLTPGHYLRTATGALVAAREVAPGTLVEHAQEGVVAVEAVRRVKAVGLYAPHTMGDAGDVYVDGFRASEYTTAVRPDVAKALLAPLKWMYGVGAGWVYEGMLARSGHKWAALVPGGASKVEL